MIDELLAGAPMASKMNKKVNNERMKNEGKANSLKYCEYIRSW